MRKEKLTEQDGLCLTTNEKRKAGASRLERLAGVGRRAVDRPDGTPPGPAGRRGLYGKLVRRG